MGTLFESNIGKISGQVVYFASGFNTVNTVVSLSGVTSDVSGRTVWIADTSGGGIETFAIGGERFLRVSISGQPITANVNVAANVSGNIVYLTSGHNEVQVNNTVTVNGNVSTSVSGNNVRAQFFDPSGNVWRDPWVDRSGGHKLQVTASGDAYTISNTVTIAGAVTTSVSGNVISTSISGNIVNTSGQVARAEISGDTIRLASGFNSVQNSGEQIRIQGFDPSGNTWRDVWFSESGGHKLLVDAEISTQVETNVSGQVVYLASGFNPVQISGQTITIGNSSLAVTTNISGNTIRTASGFNAVQISGQTITIGNSSLAVTTSVSGNSVNSNVSGNTIRAQAFDPSGNTWRDLWVNQSGGNSLLVSAAITTNISGNVVYLTSGQNPVQISGQTVVVGGTVTIAGAVTTSISGNYVSTSGSAVVISGQRVRTSGEAAIISGQTIVAEMKIQDDAESSIVNVKEYRSGSKGVLVGGFIPTRLKSYPILYASAASGGTALDSGICKYVTLKNISTSSGAVVLVGFSGTNNSPFAQTATSGRGFSLRDGDGLKIETTNPAFVRVVGVTSGQPISYFTINDI